MAKKRKKSRRKKGDSAIGEIPEEPGRETHRADGEKDSLNVGEQDSEEGVKNPGDVMDEADSGLSKPVETDTILDKEKVTSFGSALKFLKDIKELIVIIVFFVGGAAWIYSAFATKQYVAGVRCLLAATIVRIDNEAQSRQLKAEMIETGVQLQNFRNRQADLKANEIIEAEKIATHYQELETRKKFADNVVQQSSAKILNGECEQ